MTIYRSSLHLIYSAIPKEEKKKKNPNSVITLATEVTFYLEAAELFQGKKLREKKRERERASADIPSSLGDGFSSQAENYVQTPLSSCCPTLKDSTLH